MTDGLDGRVAVIAGAAGGIGAALSRTLVDAGCRAMLVDRDPAVASLATELAAEALHTDLSEDGAADSAIAAAIAAYGRTDLVVHCAGVQRRGTVLSLSREEWDTLAAINLRSVVELTRAGGAAMVEQGEGGAICLVSSMSATRALPNIVPYGALKAGVSQLTRGLAAELGPSGIRINAVSPGYIKTPMTDDLFAARADELRDRVPLGRLGTPDDVACTVRFLLSDAAAYVTGAVLPVDGGYSLG